MNKLVKYGATPSTPPEASPMLARLGKDPFDNPSWVFEIKFDGYRIIARKTGEERTLVSRNGKVFNEKYPEIVKEMEVIPHDCMLDGEMVVLGQDGRSDFQQLQNLGSSSRKNLFYYVFDVLWVDGFSLLEVSLDRRKRVLADLLPEALERIRYSDHVEGKGRAFYRKAESMELEGMIAKRKGSHYRPGKRSPDWLKIKTVKEQEVVIAGYTPAKGSRRYFGSLVMGVHDEKGQLRYAGKVGTGFEEREIKKIYEYLVALETDTPPLKTRRVKDVQWVKPELLAQVEFAEWTSGGLMRSPRYKGLREDKSPLKVKKEVPEDDTTRIDTAPGLTNPEKIFFPDEEFTKKDVYQYYEAIAEIILPYLKNRPQSLYRTPDGIDGEGFFQKDVSGQVPAWARTIEISSIDSGNIRTSLLCQDKRTLLFMANWGCIEINPWNAALPDLEKPDYVVFDLDPVEIGFEKVVEVALGFRKLFDELKVPFYCKTSGSRGMHIYLPIEKRYSHEQTRYFAQLLESIIRNRFKSITSFERKPEQRKGRIYLDYLQNGRGRTMTAPYSLRPRPGASVSAPLSPGEVRQGLDPSAFNILTVPERLAKRGDPWNGFFSGQVIMEEVIRSLESIAPV